MIKDFKFLSNNNVTDYDGIIPQEAVRLVNDYVVGRFSSAYRFTTDVAEYSITKNIYRQGELTAVVVRVYPNDEDFAITFWVNVGNVYPFITEHTIDYDRL